MYQCETKTLTIQDPSQRTHSLSFTQNSHLGHAGVIWGGSFLLIHFLQRNPQMKAKLGLSPMSKILELGAGTGLVGFALALLYRPQKVIITDLPHCVSIIEEAY